LVKMLFICNKDVKNPKAGGGTWEGFRLMSRLAQNGHNIILVCPNYKGGSKEETIEGIKVKRVGNDLSFYIQLVFSYLFSTELRSCDLVVELVLYGLPFFSPLFSGKPVMAVCWHLPRETFFAEFETYFGGVKGKLLAVVAYFIEEKLFPMFYGERPMFTFSESTRTEFIDLGFKDVMMVNKALARAIMFTSLGDDVNDVTIWYNPSIKKTEYPSALYLGRLKRYKGVQDAIRAMVSVTKCFPEAKLYIMGVGDYETQLKNLVHKLSLEESVIFLGYLSHSEKIKTLQKAHLLVMPSYREGFATPVLEAAMCGTPSVISDAVGVKDAVVHGETGFVFPLGNHVKMAEYIKILFRDEGLRKRMEAQALKSAEAFLRDWRSNEDAFVKAFEMKIKEVRIK